MNGIDLPLYNCNSLVQELWVLSKTIGSACLQLTSFVIVPDHEGECEIGFR